MMTKSIETHPLAPFLPNHARVLMLGSFPPPQNRWKMPFYYPNFNNDMWRILGLVFFDDQNYFIDTANKDFYQAKIERFLNDIGMAVADSAYQVIRLENNASDKFLQIVTPSDIKQILKQLPHCQTIITTGEKACETVCQTYQTTPAIPKVGQSTTLTINQQTITLYRLPSSSRAYPLALSKKAEHYKAILAKYFLTV